MHESDKWWLIRPSGALSTWFAYAITHEQVQSPRGNQQHLIQAEEPLNLWPEEKVNALSRHYHTPTSHNAWLLCETLRNGIHTLFLQIYGICCHLLCHSRSIMWSAALVLQLWVILLITQYCKRGHWAVGWNCSRIAIQICIENHTTETHWKGTVIKSCHTLCVSRDAAYKPDSNGYLQMSSCLTTYVLP